jgi:hypothetical protein
VSNSHVLLSPSKELEAVFHSEIFANESMKDTF